MIFDNGQKIVFIGDSITDCGRRDAEAPFGNGYMNLVRCLITARYPERGLSWENRGVGGDTVRQLEARWDQDVIAERPDWLSVKIGINDVWRAFGTNAHEAVAIDEYEATYRRLLQRAVDETGCRLIVVAPYVIDPDRSDPMRQQMDRFGLVTGTLATEFGAIHVRTQSAFDVALASTSPTDWAADRVHPNLAGHAIIAMTFLKALEFDLNS